MFVVNKAWVCPSFKGRTCSRIMLKPFTILKLPLITVFMGVACFSTNAARHNLLISISKQKCSRTNHHQHLLPHHLMNSSHILHYSEENSCSSLDHLFDGSLLTKTSSFLTPFFSLPVPRSTLLWTSSYILVMSASDISALIESFIFSKTLLP